tara:strand:- start:29956 stop:30555 length:600 start_codon:yes stop_codon:yes gene_type:complete
MFGLFKKEKKNKEVKESTLKNIQVGSFLEFGLIIEEPFHVLSEKEVKIEDLMNLKTKVFEKSFYKLDTDNLYLSVHDSKNIELLKQIENVQNFIDNAVDEEFDAVLELEESEIQDDVVSQDNSFIVKNVTDDSLMKGRYYRVVDTIQGTVNSKEKRVFCFKHENNTAYVYGFINDQGDTKLYASKLLPKFYVSNIILSH